MYYAGEGEDYNDVDSEYSDDSEDATVQPVQSNGAMKHGTKRGADDSAEQRQSKYERVDSDDDDDAEAEAGEYDDDDGSGDD